MGHCLLPGVIKALPATFAARPSIVFLKSVDHASKLHRANTWQWPVGHSAAGEPPVKVRYGLETGELRLGGLSMRDDQWSAMFC